MNINCCINCGSNEIEIKEKWEVKEYYRSNGLLTKGSRPSLYIITCNDCKQETRVKIGT
jgi:hypothetical protein